ncbi:hypothetical protein [Herbiconiux sp. YIM B11900]
MNTVTPSATEDENFTFSTSEPTLLEIDACEKYLRDGCRVDTEWTHSLAN